MTLPPGDDWQNHKSVLESNRYMIENQIDCDVRFILLPPGGETVNVGAHRYALISRSPVFFAMFSGPLANKEKDIKITDISPPIFWQFLRYLYYEDLSLSDDSVFAVLYAAKKYLVTSLADKCVDHLGAILRPDNVCIFLENSFLFEEDAMLKKKCHQMIQRHSKKVFHSESFYQSSRETLCQVLKMERLNVHEIDVFRASVHWAERKASEQNLTASRSNKRNMLGDALFLIHIPAMNINEFTKIVVPTGILDAEEENLLFRMMLDRENSTAHLQALPFPSNCRNFVATRCDIVCEGFVRHVSQLASMFQGNPQRSRWFLTCYCEHSIKIQEIGFFGFMKGNISITQSGFRKLDVSFQSPVQSIQFGDDLHLDAGQFTISADVPFTYTGEYYSKGVSSAAPSVKLDFDKINIAVRDCSALCFVSYLVFVPTDEIYFIENYYSEDSEKEVVTSD